MKQTSDGKEVIKRKVGNKWHISSGLAKLKNLPLVYEIPKTYPLVQTSTSLERPPLWSIPRIWAVKWNYQQIKMVYDNTKAKRKDAH